MIVFYFKTKTKTKSVCYIILKFDISIVMKNENKLTIYKKVFYNM